MYVHITYSSILHLVFVCQMMHRLFALTITYPVELEVGHYGSANDHCQSADCVFASQPLREFFYIYAK